MKLKVRDIEFSYNNSTSLLQQICMDVKVHEVLAILGPNGVGKSTLLKCINGLLKTRTGTIMVDEEELRKMSRIDVAKKIGYVPQRADVSKITVFDSVLLGRKPHINWDITKRDIKVAKDVINRLGLDMLSLNYIDEISGGELQKVQIARALVQEPKILLLDEPTSNLDLCNQHRIMTTLVDVVKKSDLTAVMTMHDLNLAMQYSDKFIMLKKGKIFVAGGHEVLSPQNIEAVYDLPVNVANYMGRPIVIPL
ncbi:MAG: ABC transporter ATP-binding protein [Candidatus Lokiarchaeota archaeon]|jgi:iron complex transport system ATP-binding protein